MNQVNWVSIVAMAGWLVLAISAVRAHRIGARKMLVMALAWASIFLLVAMVFASVGG